MNSLLLYVISTVFVSYLSFKSIIHPATWNALFWIILLFASVNGISKSFMNEGRGAFLYLYTLASPQAVITAKMIYNTLLMLLISFLAFAIYSLFIGNLVQDIGLFMLVLALGSIGFSCILTLIAGISAKTNNSFSIMAILSFPVIVPLLMALVKVSKNAVDGLSWSVSTSLLLTIGLLNVIVIILSYLLFPYLWKD